MHALVYHMNFQLKYFIQHIKKHQLPLFEYVWTTWILRVKEYEIQQLKIKFEKSQLNQILLTDKEMYGSLY